jgi:hypothetical protein
MFATSDSVGAPTSHLDAPVGRLVLAPLASGKQLRCRGAPPATSFEGQGSKLTMACQGAAAVEMAALPAGFHRTISWIRVGCGGGYCGPPPGHVFRRGVIFGSMTAWSQAIVDKQGAAPRRLLLGICDQEAAMDAPDMLWSQNSFEFTAHFGRVCFVLLISRQSVDHRFRSVSTPAV